MHTPKNTYIPVSHPHEACEAAVLQLMNTTGVISVNTDKVELCEIISTASHITSWKRGLLQELWEPESSLYTKKNAL